jgi:hypothetical protein
MGGGIIKVSMEDDVMGDVLGFGEVAVFLEPRAERNLFCLEVLDLFARVKGGEGREGLGNWKRGEGRDIHTLNPLKIRYLNKSFPCRLI